MNTRRILNRYSGMEYLRGPVAAHGGLIPVYGRNSYGQLELVFTAPNDEILKAILKAIMETPTNAE
jgi:hypothetical protein